MSEFRPLGGFIPSQIPDPAEQQRTRQPSVSADRGKRQIASESIIPDDNQLFARVARARESAQTGRMPGRGSVLNILV